MNYRLSNGRTDNPITRCPHFAFQAGQKNDKHSDTFRFSINFKGNNPLRHILPTL